MKIDKESYNARAEALESTLREIAPGIEWGVDRADAFKDRPQFIANGQYLFVHGRLFDAQLDKLVDNVRLGEDANVDVVAGFVAHEYATAFGFYFAGIERKAKTLRFVSFEEEEWLEGVNDGR